MKSIRVYPYRWVVLGALMVVIMVSEMQWLVFAPVSRAASEFYGSQIPDHSLFSPDLLTIIHFVSFLIFSVPFSYLIHKVGLKWSLRIASLLLAFFSLMKGLTAASLTSVVVSQVGLSLGHVIILSSVTAVTNRWFPLKERGFATGLVSLFQYLGLLLIMIISPRVISVDPTHADYGGGLPSLLLGLGIATSVSALAVLFLFKEQPPTPPTQKLEKISGFGESLVLLLKKKHMGGFMIIFGLSWGLFNVFVAKTDSITAFVNIKDSNGLLGLLLLLGGMVGTVIIPLLSDHYRKRKFFFSLSMFGLFVMMILFSFIPLFLSSGMPFFFVYVIVAVLGFFFQSTVPLGYQYAHELAYPVQETSSQTALLLAGHLVGTAMLVTMNMGGGIYLEKTLIAAIALVFAALFGSLFVKESPMIVTEEEKLKDLARKEWIHQR